MEPWRLKRHLQRLARDRAAFEQALYAATKRQYDGDLLAPIEASIRADRRPWLRRGFGRFVLALDA